MKLDGDPIQWLEHFEPEDPAGLAKSLREHIRRGDFTGWLAIRARFSLWKAERRVRIAEGLTPQGLALRQTRAAERSAIAASIAVGVSIVALVISVIALARS